MRFSLRPYIGPLFAAALLLVLSACDSGGANTPGSVTGQWEGTVETDSVRYELAFDVERAEESGPTGSRLVGDGQLVGDEPWAFNITDGSFTEPNLSVTLTLRFDESMWPIHLDGTVGEEYQEISAELTGGPPRFDSKPVTLTRP